MGDPVKIVDLARDMVRLSGLTLGEDIEIEFTGAKQGEKLREELLIEDEGVQSTSFGKIFVAAPSVYEFGKLQGWIEQLTSAAQASSDEHILRVMKQMGISFQSTESQITKYAPNSINA